MLVAVTVETTSVLEGGHILDQALGGGVGGLEQRKRTRGVGLDHRFGFILHFGADVRSKKKEGLYEYLGRAS